MEKQCSRVLQEVEKVIKGKEQEKQLILAAILAKGHILLDDIPGVGKTTLTMAFSRAMQLETNRMQFTSDVLPSDVLGFHLIRPDGTKEYQKGVILCNLFMADEINRASSKTQSALLEVMEEGKVTIEGDSHPAPEPFVVMATQNPVGFVGTQMLPESQVDRFMICLTLGYPTHEEEILLLQERQGENPLGKVQTILEKNELLEMQKRVKEIHVDGKIYDYMVTLSEKTRNHPLLSLGMSPRGTVALMEISKAVAFMNERTCVYPEDVIFAFPYIARHRIYLTAKAKVENHNKDEIIHEILAQVKVR
ncbi:MAG: MoxR family ATPase [Eubacterium sp.]|nr:MoxR family ATPase [Eubacterium sp.]